MAGSNATTRGVPRRILQGDGPTVPVIGGGQIPTIQYSTGNARALQEFSRNLFNLSGQFEDQLDAQAEAEAQTQGALDGAKGEFELQNYGTIRGRAYNKAAVETFAATIDTQSMVKLNALQQQFWNDPAGLEREWNNWRTGYKQELEKRSPEQAIAFDNRAQIRGLPAIEQARDTAYKLTRSEADAALIENEAALRSEIKNVSSDLFSENPDRSRAAANAIGMVQNDFMKIYSAKDPISGRPLYSPEEIAKAKKSFTDLTMSQAALSWFDEQPDKAGAYLKFASGEFKIKLNSSNDQVPLVMANKGATRNDPLQQDIANRMKAAAAATGIPGVGVVVHSGGQETHEEVRAGRGSRTGSTRHDHGGAGDVRLAVNGKVLDFASNREAYLKFAENAAAAGLTGIGVDEQKGYLHLGGGSQAEWGYRGNMNGRQFLPGDFAQAIANGRKNKLDYKPSVTEVGLNETISESAFNSLDAEMRSRISFANQMTDRQNTAQKAAMEAQQDKNAFDYTSRLYAAGTTNPTTGQVVQPLTREAIMEATGRGLLKPGDGEAIMKALATEKPEVSDQATYRDLIARVYSGEDIYRSILDAGSKLSAKDAEELLGKNQSIVRNKLGEFDSEQKYYLNTLNDRLGGSGMFDKFDQGKADRKAQALDEFRRRVMDPANTEPPSVIADDIAGRATADAISMDQSKLGRMVMPRFSVPIQGQNRIDVVASKNALLAARAGKQITEEQFMKEAQRLVDWDRLQKQLDRTTTAPKGK